MKKYLILLLCASFLFVPGVDATEFSIHSKNAILYNVEEKTVMYSKNPDQKAMIASLTKVMTALTVLEKNPDLNKKIKMSDYADYNYIKKKDLSNSSYDKNKEYSYKDLLYSFILESSADCGYALAKDISGSEKNFVKEMNKEAEKVGMPSSHFSNPIGIDDPNNYATMTDMLKLMKTALNNKSLKEIMSTFVYKAEDGTEIYHSLAPYVNKDATNPIAKSLYMDYLKGGKTGTEEIPGHALMSYANKNGTTYILVTTNAKDNKNAPEHVEDAKTIYSYYFNNYEYKTLVKKGFNLITLKTKYLKEDKVDVIMKDDIKYFTDKTFDTNKVLVRYEGIKTITPKYKKGDKLGNCYIYYDNDLIKTVKVTLDQDTHMSFIDFINYNKYIFIASICYLVIILGTIITVVKIKKKKKAWN